MLFLRGEGVVIFEGERCRGECLGQYDCGGEGGRGGERNRFSNQVKE